MKVHLKQIPAEGLVLEGEADSSLLDLHESNIRPLTGIRYRLEVGISDGGLFATGTIAIDFELECVRCLEKFVYPIQIEDFALQTELTGPEMIDLTPMVREDILLALPAYPRCDWDGSNQCPGAGSAAKASETGSHISSETESASAAQTQAWDALKQLQIRPRS
ncbi:MAG TPA: DUF177 domain-containing protein [Chthoniobacterales bacterium]